MNSGNFEKKSVPLWQQRLHFPMPTWVPYFTPSLGALQQRALGYFQSWATGENPTNCYITQKGIAAQLGITKQAVSRVIKSLKSENLLAQVPRKVGNSKKLCWVVVHPWEYFAYWVKQGKFSQSGIQAVSRGGEIHVIETTFGGVEQSPFQVRLRPLKELMEEFEKEEQVNTMMTASHHDAVPVVVMMTASHHDDAQSNNISNNTNQSTYKKEKEKKESSSNGASLSLSSENASDESVEQFSEDPPPPQLGSEPDPKPERESDSERKPKRGSKQTKKPKKRVYDEFRASDFEIPETWDAEALNALKDWVAHKSADKRRAPATKLAYQKLITEWAKNPRGFIAAVRATIFHNDEENPEGKQWQKPYPPKSTNQAGRRSGLVASIDEVEERREEIRARLRRGTAPIDADGEVVP